jgi:hypothetical protein
MCNMRRMKPISKAELQRAQDWRNARNLTMQQLAELTGYSASNICRFEGGVIPASQTQPEHPVTPKAFRRYKMICLAVDMLFRAGKKVEDWQWS